MSYTNTTSLGGLRPGLGSALPGSTPNASTASPLIAAAHSAISAINAATPAQIASRDGLPAVRAFQTAYGHDLVADGRFGTHTRAALLAVVPGATLPGGAATARTRTSISPSTGAPVSASPDEPIDPAADPARPAWVVPAIVVGSVVLLGSGALILQRSMRRNRSSRLRRNRRRAR